MKNLITGKTKLNKSGIFIIYAFCVFLYACTIAAAADVVKHPSLLKYDALDYSPPDPAEYRHVLKNGMVIYFYEDHTLPVVDITAYCRTGSIMDKKEEWGLASATAYMMRNGGAGIYSADDFNEQAEYLAASIDCQMELTQAKARLSVLKENFESGMNLFCEMLRFPQFNTEKLVLYQDRLCEGITHRYDDSREVMEIAYNKFLNPDFPTSYLLDSSIVRSFTNQRLKEFYTNNFCPNRIILAVSGDISRKNMIKKLERMFGKWKNITLDNKAIVIPDMPEYSGRGLYFIQKEATQVNVKMGYPLIQRPHEDFYALTLMNYLLGGGGFNSRIVAAVREQKGLAYNIRSSVESNYFFPGTFNVYVGTKSSSFIQAVNLIFEEINKFKEEKITDEELEKAKDYFILSLPSYFRTSAKIVETFAQSEYWGRGLDHYKQYIRKLNAIKPEDIQRVAKKYLDVNKLAIICVGDYNNCAADKRGMINWGPIKRLVTEDLEK
ncbi:MAG: pitrilysin family protein, partial [bacterium]